MCGERYTMYNRYDGKIDCTFLKEHRVFYSSLSELSHCCASEGNFIHLRRDKLLRFCGPVRLMNFILRKKVCCFNIVIITWTKACIDIGTHLGVLHAAVPIKQVTSGIRKQVKQLTEEVYKKMKRCRNIEKSVWRRLSDYEEHVETIHKRIDDTIEQLVRISLPQVQNQNNLFSYK